MKNTILISLSLSFVLLISACCGDCNSNYLGQFLVKSSSKEWIAYADNQNRLFKGAGIQTAVFSYSLPLFALNTDVFNCQIDAQCGTCCDEYELETAFFEMTSNDLNVRFNFSMQPDFITKTPLDPPAQINDFLTVIMSNKLTGDLFLDNIQLKDRVTVNGKEYRNLFAVEVDRATLDTTTQEPWAFYLQKEKGIVAFKLANGEEWNLHE